MLLELIRQFDRVSLSRIALILAGSFTEDATPVTHHALFNAAC